MEHLHLRPLLGCGGADASCPDRARTGLSCRQRGLDRLAERPWRPIRYLRLYLRQGDAAGGRVLCGTDRRYGAAPCLIHRSLKRRPRHLGVGFRGRGDPDLAEPAAHLRGPWRVHRLTHGEQPVRIRHDHKDRPHSCNIADGASGGPLLGAVAVGACAPQGAFQRRIVRKTHNLALGLWGWRDIDATEPKAHLR